VPRQSQAGYDEASDATVAELGPLVHRLLNRLEAVLPNPAYNYYLHSAPFDMDSNIPYRWHWEIAPRTMGLAGWEIGGGTFINAVAPEEAAERLRSSNTF
jgi:UDPglucose--hexose-1-phosphate uridylyltransferase